MATPPAGSHPRGGIYGRQADLLTVLIRTESLTTAATMYREMDMRFWLEQAEAELRRP